MKDIFLTNSGLNDPNWSKFVSKVVFTLFLIVLFASIFSYGFYHYDEHYQIVEYVGLKLGKSSQSDMTWEYHSKIRPWLQPAIYYLVAKPLIFCKISDPFYLTLAFRLVTGIFGIVAITLLILLANFYYKDDNDKKRAIVYIFLTLFFIPYFIVRTSSESMSTSFFVMGFAILLLFSKNSVRGDGKKDRDEINPSKVIFLFAGLLFGLAFQFRYQIIFMIIGFGLWLLFFSSKNYLKTLVNLTVMISGFGITIIIGILVDYWGYGEWGVSFWNYFYRNLVLKASENWGVEPFWGYLYLINLNIFFPITLFITFSFFVYWIRYPKSNITFITLLFFLGHSIIAHKEARFLFPMVLFVPFVIVDAFNKEGDRLRFLNKIYQLRKGILAKIFYGFNILSLIFLIFFDNRFDLPIQKKVLRLKNVEKIYYIDSANPYDNYGAKMNFYKPPTISLHQIDKLDIPIVMEKEHVIYLVSDGLINPIHSTDSYKVSVIYQKFPQFFINLPIVKRVLDMPKIKSRIRYYTLYKLVRDQS